MIKLVLKPFLKAFLISGLTGCLYIYISWRRVSPAGPIKGLESIAGIWLVALVLTGIYNLLYGAARAVGIVFGVKSIDKRKTLEQIVVSLTFTIVLVIAVSWSEDTKTRAYKNVAIRGRPLVAAIKKYEAKNQCPPSSLQKLIPEFLAQIPSTDMSPHSSFHYLVNHGSSNYCGSAWALVVPASLDELGSDFIVYFPNSDCLNTTNYGLSLRRFGEWIQITVTTEEAKAEGLLPADAPQ